MTAYINCPHCKAGIENRGETCPRCGGVLKLRKGASREPHQMSKDMIKFLWLAIAVMVLLVPLGMCIRPG